MSIEENKALVRQYVEAIHRGDIEEGEELVAADFVFHISGSPAPLNRETFRTRFASLLAGFPDLSVASEELTAEGDLVAGRWTTRGTHLGDLWGIPATGERVTITSMDMNRIADGKIAERWHEYDTLGLMQQLGVIPTPTQAES